MLVQTDERLNSNINKSGCLLMSLCAIAQLENKKVLDAYDINTIYEVCLSKNYIDEDCTVSDPDGVLFVANKILANNQLTIWQVGGMENHKVYWWNTNKKEYSWMIRKIKTGKDKYHFFVLDRFGNKFYDPETRPYNNLGVERDNFYRTIEN